jgi:hypothetical protein
MHFSLAAFYDRRCGFDGYGNLRFILRKAFEWHAMFHPHNGVMFFERLHNDAAILYPPPSVSLPVN